MSTIYMKMQSAFLAKDCYRIEKIIFIIKQIYFFMRGLEDNFLGEIVNLISFFSLSFVVIQLHESIL